MVRQVEIINLINPPWNLICFLWTEAHVTSAFSDHADGNGRPIRLILPALVFGDRTMWWKTRFQMLWIYFAL